MDSFRLAAVVGTGGLATPICRALVEQKRRVAVGYFPGNVDIRKWLSDFKYTAGMIDAFPLDITDEKSRENFVQDAETAFGRPITILVNAAGIIRDSMLKDLDLEDLRAVMDTNFTGPLFMMKRVLVGMGVEKFGRIVNISSVIGQCGGFAQVHYAAAKAALQAASMSLASEVAKHNITVNCVAPGFIKTAMTDDIPTEVVEKRILPKIPMGRFGTPGEIAHIVASLTHDDASYVHGTTVSVNGGYHMQH